VRYKVQTAVAFFQIHQLGLSIRSGAHKLLRRFFWIFAIFDRNFANIVAPPSDGKEKYVAHLKERSLLKKAENRVEIWQ